MKKDENTEHFEALLSMFSEKHTDSDRIYKAESLTPVPAAEGRVKLALRFEGENDCFTGEGATALSAKTDAARQAYETYSMRAGGARVRIMWNENK